MHHMDSIGHSMENMSIYQTMVESAVLPILIYQHEYIVYSNPAAEQVMGYEQSRLVGVHIRDIVHPGDLSNVLQLGVNRLAATTYPEHPESDLRILKQDGSELWVHYHAAVIAFEGHPATLISVSSVGSLKSSDQMYHALFENAHSANMLLQEGRFIDCNHEAIRLFSNYDKSHFCSLYLWQISPPFQPDGQDSQQAALNYIEQSMQQGYCRFEWQHQRCDGSQFDAEILLRRVEWGMETVIHAAVIDISERKEKERELQHRLAIEHALAKASRFLISNHASEIKNALGVFGHVMQVDRVYIFEFDSKLASMSNTYEWCAESVCAEIENLQLISTSFFPWWMGQLKSNHCINISDVAAMPLQSQSEKVILKQQSIQALLAVPMIDPKGKLLGFIGFDDVHGPRQWAEDDIRMLQVVAEMIAVKLLSKRIYQQLKQNRKDLLKAQEIAQIGSWKLTKNVHKTTLELSEQTLSLLGLPVDFVCSFRNILKKIDPAERSQTVQVLRDAWQGEQFIPIQICMGSGDTKQYLDIRGEGIFKTEQLLLHGTVQDITENVEMEKMNQAVLKAQAESKAKGDFLAVMSHELRTPLHGIIGLQNLLAQELSDIPSRQKEHLALAQHSAHILSSLIDDILDLSKIESGSMELQPIVFDLPALLNNTLLGFLPGVRQQGVELILQLDAIPRHVIGDEGRIRQILLNLIGNAVKFTAQGVIRLQASYEHANHCLQIEIHDTGVGMDEVTLSTLFEPFKSFGAMTECQGTGLGTTIAMKFTHMMQGDISVQSEWGEGSVFTLCLPLEASGDGSCISQTENMNIQVIESTPTCGLKLQELRVLLAEDDPIARFIAEENLQSAGLQVDIAENGLIAWDMLQNNVYDVLITDIRMPGIDGIELVHKIRSTERQYENTTSMLIIGLSAHAMSHVAEEAYAAGMDDFIAKPIDAHVLMQRLSQIQANVTGAEYAHV